MNKIFLLILFLSCLQLRAQTDVVELGILPAEYAEGMPPAEFQKIEEKIVEYIGAIPRYKIVKTQEDFYDAQWGDDWYTHMEAIRKQGQKSNVPYLLQIVFGDTEWKSKLEPIRAPKPVANTSAKTTDTGNKSNAKKELLTKQTNPKKESLEEKKQETKKENQTESNKSSQEKIPQIWTHNATISITINLYKVETGELEKSEVFQATAFGDGIDYKTVKKRAEFKYAVATAKNSVLAKIKSSLKKLVPFGIEISEPVETSKKAIKKIKVNAGTYHGLAERDRLYVYYETGHKVDGEIVIREIFVCSLVIDEVSKTSAVCKVKKGGKDLLSLLGKKDLKCKIQDYYYVAGYGF